MMMAHFSFVIASAVIVSAVKIHTGRLLGKKIMFSDVKMLKRPEQPSPHPYQIVCFSFHLKRTPSSTLKHLDYLKVVMVKWEMS